MNYIIFDLEATCWNYKQEHPAETIEIGAVKIREVDGQLKMVGGYNAFVNPILAPVLSKFCIKLTSISQLDVDFADTFDKVILDFQQWIHCDEQGGIDSDYWLGSWGHYDRRQLKADCVLHNLPIEWLKYHISLKHQFSAKRNIKCVGMMKALEMLNIQPEGVHHRAIYDAINTGKIFIEAFSDFKFEKVTNL